MIFIQVLLPVIIILFLGYLVGKFRSLDLKSLTELSLYVLSPCLVFSSLIGSTVGRQEVITMSLFILLHLTTMGILAYLLARALRFSRVMRNVFPLATLFTNSGNYGLPVCLFAFGEKGFDLAIIYMITQSILMGSVAVFLASRHQNNWRESIMNIFRFPSIYAIAVAFMLRFLRITLPSSFLRPVELLGKAAIPIVLLILGVQLSMFHLAQKEHTKIGLATIMKLVIAPLVAFGLVFIIGMTGLVGKVAIIQSSMPTAVNISILAIKFDAEPDFVSSVVFISTLISVISLSVILYLL